jgi:hypothetical protein
VLKVAEQAQFKEMNAILAAPDTEVPARMFLPPNPPCTVPNVPLNVPLLPLTRMDSSNPSMTGVCKDIRG